jgi:hypothetical protein
MEAGLYSLGAEADGFDSQGMQVTLAKLLFASILKNTPARRAAIDARDRSGSDQFSSRNDSSPG